MKTKYTLSILLVSALIFSGCKKYTDIKTQGNLVPGDTENYRLLLNNTYALENGPRLGDFSSSDLQINDGSTLESNMLSGGDYYAYYPNAYAWKDVIYPVSSVYYQDQDWNNMYTTITYCNTVINELPASSGNAADKTELTAEALVHRADAYMMLLNTYAKPYNSATSATDPGVPLLLTQSVTASLVRTPVQQVYEQIIVDLKKAISGLPANQAYSTLPSKPAAYAELARCYLYMNNYAQSSVYADSALITRNTLNDLAPLTSVSSSNYPLRAADPEVILSKVATGGISAYSSTAMRLSDDLLSFLDPKDQRYALFTAPDSVIFYYSTGDSTGRYFYKDRAVGEGRNIGPSVPEMMLIKAEYFARNGDVISAMSWVNKLRIKRFTAANYVAMTATSANDALVKVVQERRREFFCRMLPWWDMRRLKNDALFARTYTRVFGGVTYTLAPTSNRYVFQISEYLRQLNPEMVQNP